MKKETWKMVIQIAISILTQGSTRVGHHILDATLVQWWQLRSLRPARWR